MLIEPLVVVRAIHFASTVIVAGSLVFRAFIADPVRRRTDDALGKPWVRFDRQSAYLQRFGLVLAVASGSVRLVLVAADITGEPWQDVISDGMAWTVLTETQFGFVSQFRLLTAIILAVLLLWPNRAPHTTGWLGILMPATAALFLGSLSWAGHASAGLGLGGGLHLASDIVHVLAAGAWVGGLIPLLLLLGQLSMPADSRQLIVTSEVLRRFSTMGVVSVGTLVASGVLNTWFLTDHLRALFGTEYGRLVQIKIVLFLAMFCLATVNRVRLAPHVAQVGDAESLQRGLRAAQQLRRNMAIEIALGLAVIYVVGVLGVTPPAGHVHHALAGL